MDSFIKAVGAYRTYKDCKYMFKGVDPDDLTDPRNMVRKCPYCGVIWMKSDGCRNQTVCGNRPSWFDVFTSYIF